MTTPTLADRAAAIATAAAALFVAALLWAERLGWVPHP